MPCQVKMMNRSLDFIAHFCVINVSNKRHGFRLFDCHPEPKEDIYPKVHQGIGKSGKTQKIWVN